MNDKQAIDMLKQKTYVVAEDRTKNQLQMSTFLKSNECNRKKY